MNKSFGIADIQISADTPIKTASRPKRKLKRRSIVSDEEWVIRMTEVLDSSGERAVADYIQLHTMLNRKTTIQLTTYELRAWGISKDTKARSLRKLELAGLVQVEWRDRHNPSVTVLGPLWGVNQPRKED